MGRGWLCGYVLFLRIRGIFANGWMRAVGVLSLLGACTTVLTIVYFCTLHSTNISGLGEISASAVRRRRVSVCNDSSNQQAVSDALVERVHKQSASFAIESEGIHSLGTLLFMIASADTRRILLVDKQISTAVSFCEMGFNVIMVIFVTYSWADWDTKRALKCSRTGNAIALFVHESPSNFKDGFRVTLLHRTFVNKLRVREAPIDKVLFCEGDVGVNANWMSAYLAAEERLNRDELGHNYAPASLLYDIAGQYNCSDAESVCDPISFGEDSCKISLPNFARPWGPHLHKVVLINGDVYLQLIPQYNAMYFLTMSEVQALDDIGQWCMEWPWSAGIMQAEVKCEFS